MDFTTKDSGARDVFATGSRRDSRAGKGRYDLISPHMLRRLAEVLERGAEKYGERNWELGQPYGRTLDSTLRHLNQFAMSEVDEDHLGHAVFGVMALIHFEEEIRLGRLSAGLDDRRKPAPLASAAPENFDGRWTFCNRNFTSFYEIVGDSACFVAPDGTRLAEKPEGIKDIIGRIRAGRLVPYTRTDNPIDAKPPEPRHDIGSDFPTVNLGPSFGDVRLTPVTVFPPKPTAPKPANHYDGRWSVNQFADRSHIVIRGESMLIVQDDGSVDTVADDRKQAIRDKIDAGVLKPYQRVDGVSPTTGGAA